MGDDADVTTAGDASQHIHHIVQELIGQRAEPLIDEQRIHRDPAVLGLDDIGKRQRQCQRDEEGFAAGQRAGLGGDVGTPVEHLDGQTRFASGPPFMIAKTQLVDSSTDVFEQLVGTVEHVAETFGDGIGDERHLVRRRRIPIPHGKQGHGTDRRIGDHGLPPVGRHNAQLARIAPTFGVKR